MPEENKTIQTVIQAFYHGGTKLKAGLLMTRDAVEGEIKAARLNNRDARFATADEDKTISDSYIYINVGSNLMFYNIHTPIAPSIITG